MSLLSLKISKEELKERKENALPRSICYQNHFNNKSIIPRKETPRCTPLPAVFTLEAAIIFPLMASFFVSILFFFRVLQVELEVQKALCDTGRQLAVYLAASENGATEDLAIAQGLFLSEVAASETVDAYVSGGGLGISLLHSEFSEDEIHLIGRYGIRLPIRLFWSQELQMEQRTVCRKWTGWNETSGNETQDDWVYITETGGVYHSSSTCSHLELSIQSVSQDQVQYMRNQNGSRYRSCEQCGQTGNTWGRVYITNQGDCYHRDLNCSGIRRTVLMVRMSDVEGWRCCSRCAGT